jgi:hypothetical protein
MKTWNDGDIYKDEHSGQVWRCTGDHMSELGQFDANFWEEVHTRASHSYSTPM